MAKAAAVDVVRGGDEVGFLASRQRTSPLDPRLAREKTNNLVKSTLDFDGQLGAQGHDEGTGLEELYFGHVDVALGFPSFKAFLARRWPLDQGVAYERMRVAKLTTRAQAQKYGYTACLLGLRIMSALDVKTFTEFARRPLTLHADDGGGTVRFPAPAPALRSVLRALAQKEQPDAQPDLDVGEQLRRYNAAVTTLVETDPGIAAIKPVVWADAKGAYVRATASGPDQAKAAERLYRQISRILA